MTAGSKPSCAELFEGLCLQGRGLQEAVFAAYPKGDCEQQSVSALSPGPVADDETLTRLIVHPIHYDKETGTVHPLAFNDIATLDLSVFREERTDDAEIQLAIDEIRAGGLSQVPPKDRIVDAVMKAPSHVVRAAVFEGTNVRMFYIYDTAVPKKEGHASIFGDTSRIGKNNRSARKKLLEIFSPAIPCESYRDLIYEGNQAA